MKSFFSNYTHICFSFGSTTMLKPGVFAEPILVGREKELEELQSYLNSVVQGEGKTVFVSGEAGSGKTRLTREFLNVATKQGVAVMAGWCLNDTAAPYFPFVEAFNSYFASQETETADSLNEPTVRLSPLKSSQTITEERGVTAWLTRTEPVSKLGKPEVLSPQVWKDQLFVGVAKTLHTIATQNPVVLFIEDVQWADSASLMLLHYIARAIHDSEKVLLLATFRSEELTGDAEGHPHPLAETLRMMRREELFTEIKLPSLNQENTSRIAASMIGGSLQPRFAEKLAIESRGNPLFIVESLRMLHERKSLVQENEQWRLAVDELGIPNKIRDVILRRLACLKYAQRRVLDAASVIGEEFNVELLSTVLGQDYLEILETLNVVAHSTSLVSVEGNHYRFDHARSRETLYDELAIPLKRGYHNKIAEKLESIKNEAPRLSDMAYHYAQAGCTEKAVKYALAAGNDELGKYSNTQAIRHFQYVLQNVPEGQNEDRRAALEGLGDAYSANCMFGEAIKTFDKLAASETGVNKLRAIRKASDAVFDSKEMPDLLIEYAKKAEELGSLDRLEMARIIDNRGIAPWGDRRLRLGQGLADYEAALKVFEEENSLVDIAEALSRVGAGCAIFYDEFRVKGISELIRSCALFKELGDVRKEVEAIYWTGVGLFHCHLFSEARCKFEVVLGIGEKLGVFDVLSMASRYLGWLDSREGKIEGALSRALKALEYSKKTDSIALQEAPYGDLAECLSLLGDFEQADKCFNRFTELPPEIASNAWVTIIASVNKAKYFAAKGLWEESNQAYAKTIEIRSKSAFATIQGEEVARRGYAESLERQGRCEEARVQRDKAQELHNQLEGRFKLASLQSSLLVKRNVSVGEEFEMRLDMVNVGRKFAQIAKVECIAPIEFSFSNFPAFCSLQNGSVVLKDKRVGPFEVETLKLKLSVTKAGIFSFSAKVFYEDGSGSTKTSELDPIVITVASAKPAFEILPRRMPTGTVELDRLLLGGIPLGYSVVLAASSSDERQVLINRFLEAGIKSNETTLYVTCEAISTSDFATKFQELYLILCHPQSDLLPQNLPKVFKIKGIENLTEIDIALAKLFRTLPSATDVPKRACIDLLSDVLLQHHAVITRKWLGGLLANLKCKGFTTFAVIDPAMHALDEAQATLSLFDGEIRIFERDREKTLEILRLHNQRYSKNNLVLNKGQLSNSP